MVLVSFPILKMSMQVDAVVDVVANTAVDVEVIQQPLAVVTIKLAAVVTTKLVAVVITKLAAVALVRKQPVEADLDLEIMQPVDMALETKQPMEVDVVLVKKQPVALDAETKQPVALET